MDLLLASTNLHKIRELRQLLAPLKKFDLYSLNDFCSYIPPEETGQTFEENALLKATHAAAYSNMLTLADDSGLVVPAIDGAPGIFSARYAGKNTTDLDNRKKLLKEMSSLQGLQRAAYFECAIALAHPAGWNKCVKAIVEGLIVLEEKGKNGFGYDSLFQKYDYSLTFGQLDESIKNQISHRFKAMQKMLVILESLSISCASR